MMVELPGLLGGIRFVGEASDPDTDMTVTGLYNKAHYLQQGYQTLFVFLQCSLWGTATAGIQIAVNMNPANQIVKLRSSTGSFVDVPWTTLS